MKAYANPALWKKEQQAWETSIIENMVIFDTNVILRYILQDNQEMAEYAKEQYIIFIFDKKLQNHLKK